MSLQLKIVGLEVAVVEWRSDCSFRKHRIGSRSQPGNVSDSLRNFSCR